MKTADLFPSKYLKAADLDGDVEVTIRNVGKEDFKDDDGVIKPKGVCYFEEGELGLLCNKTNWKALVRMFGDESDNWAGKTITLTVMDVPFKDEMVPAIRVKVPRSPTGKTPFKAKKAEKSWPGEFVVALIEAKLAKTPADAVGLLNRSGLPEDVSVEKALKSIGLIVKGQKAAEDIFGKE